MDITLTPFQCLICWEKHDAILVRPVAGLCGHSVCEKCYLNLRKHTAGDCPVCKAKEAFLDPYLPITKEEDSEKKILYNLQFIANINDMKDDCSELERQIHYHRRSLILAANDEKARERRLIKKVQVIHDNIEGQILVTHHERNELEEKKRKLQNQLANSFKCSRCHGFFKGHTARICIQCFQDEEFVEVKDPGWTARILNKEEALVHAICGGCVLDSEHKSHKTVKLQEALNATRFDNGVDRFLSSVKRIREEGDEAAAHRARVALDEIDCQRKACEKSLDSQSADLFLNKALEKITEFFDQYNREEEERKSEAAKCAMVPSNSIPVIQID